MAQQHHKRLAVHSLVTFGTTIGVVLLRIVRNGVVSRALGPALRGPFSFLTLIPDFLASFADLGFGPATIYYVAKEKRDPRRVMWGVLVFGFAAGAILVALCAGALHLDLIREGQAWIVDRHFYVILAGAFLLIFMNLGGSFIMARGMIYWLNASSVFNVVVPLGLFLVMVHMRPDAALDAAFISWLVGLAIVAVLPFFLLRSQGAYPPRRDPEFLLKGMQYGLSGHFANFFQKALRRMDFVFVSAMCGPEAMGYYAVATGTAEMMLMLPESVAVPFIPIVFGMDRKDSERFTPAVVRTIFAFMALACVPVLLLGRWFIGLVHGEAFLPAFGALALLLPGMIGLAIYPILKADLFGRGRPGAVSMLVSVSLVANLVLNYLTIPRWGILGAAGSSSASYLLSMGLLYLFYCRMSRNHPVRALFWSRAEISMIWHFAVNKIRGFKNE